MKRKALVFGAGSIGERHIANLLSLGYDDIYVFRQRQLPLRSVNDSKIRVITSLEEIDTIKPDFAIICTPTSMHVKQALMCVERGIPVLIEKPLTHNIDEIQDLKASVERFGTLVHVGYMMRFHPLLMHLKKGLQENSWGKALIIRTYWGEYLPNWHPWEDYRSSYAARKELGGGAGLTLSHDLDVAHWLANSKVKRSYTLPSFASNLEVNVESAVDIQLGYENGINAHIHLNFFQKVARREYQVECENASLFIDFFANTLQIRSTQGIEVLKLEEFDRNDMFVEQTKYFINLLNQKSTHKTHALKQLDESEFIIKICTDEKFKSN